jgi:opacity protein-like surface antigen
MSGRYRGRGSPAHWQAAHITGPLPRYTGRLGLPGNNNVDVDESATFGKSGVEFGWALGAGADYRLTERVSLNFTYMHVDLGQHSSSHSYEPGPVAQGANTSKISGRAKIDVDGRFDVFRMGLNYHF